MKRNFEKWLGEFTDTISTYDYFTDFEKVYGKVDDIKVELNILNSLIGSKDIEGDFAKLVSKYPEVLKAIPILIAKREKEILVSEPAEDIIFKFNEVSNSIEDYAKFMRETGIFALLQNHLINNLIDYVTGVEVGMDTNGRKNRTGKAMETLVEQALIDKGLIKDQTYFKELRKSEIEKRFGINLASISDQKQADKRFDFVVYKDGVVSAIEVNFYSGGGSKLNETARSYKQIAIESKDIENFKFIWITDGRGWLSAKNNLKETFDVMLDIYNLGELKDLILHN